MFYSKYGSSTSGSVGLVSHLRSFFASFGVPAILSSDGGPEFKASTTSDFLKSWGVQHRLSSAYYPQSNGRAEVAVKKVKRFLFSCIGPAGTLNTDKFLEGMLQIRNTPDGDCNLSPAQTVFGRPLRDVFSFVNRQNKFSNSSIHPIWRNAWKSKEDAMRIRFTKSIESLNKNSRQLSELSVGDKVFIQNQVGHHPLKWDRSGTVVECHKFDQYFIKIHGTGRLTLRNRKFLRKFTLPNPPCTSSGMTTGLADQSVPGGAENMDPSRLPLPSTNSDLTGQIIPGVSVSDSSLTLSPSEDREGKEECGTTLSAPEPSPYSQTSQPLLDGPDEVLLVPSHVDDVSNDTVVRQRSQRSVHPPKKYIPEEGKWL